MKPRYKKLRDRAWHLCRQIVLMRDENRCVVCTGTEDLQVDHCFSRQCGMLHYDVENLNVLCSRCHSHKSFRKGGPVDKIVDQITRSRVGGKYWETMMEQSWKPNPDINRIWWLEEKLEELEEKLSYYKIRTE